MSRQEKKAQTLNIVSGQLAPEAHASLGSKECTPLSNITNSVVNQDVENPKSGKNWYARMSDEKRAEYNLNIEQRTGFEEILDHVVNNRKHVFFANGPGGTGKTYLYKALLAKVRSLGKIAIATTTFGIAASIMPSGRTAHSRFKISVKLMDNSICSFTKQSGTAELLRRASLIIWDEVTRTKRQAIEALDRSLQDIMGCVMPFGGKVVVFGGDFRQFLPVVPRGTRAQITDATLELDKYASSVI